MGTADELALDVLLNTLLGFSADMVALRSVRLGGQNEDWPLPEEDPDDDYLKVGGAGGGGGEKATRQGWPCPLSGLTGGGGC